MSNNTDIMAPYTTVAVDGFKPTPSNRNSFVRNFDGTAARHKEFFDFCAVTVLHNRYDHDVSTSCDSEGLDWIARRCQDPLVYETKEEVWLYHYYAYGPYSMDSTFTTNRKVKPSRVEHIIVDYDSDVHMMDVAAKFKDYNMVIYASTSNIKGNKFRLILETTEGMSVNLYGHPDNRDQLRSFFEGCDPSSFDVGRFFYGPAIVAGQTVYSQVVNLCGKPIDPIADIGLEEHEGYTFGDDMFSFEDFDEADDDDTPTKTATKVSFLGKTDAESYDYEAMGIKVLADIAPNVLNRGGGYDIHQNIFKVAKHLIDAFYEPESVYELMMHEFATANPGEDLSRPSEEIQEVLKKFAKKPRKL